MSNLFILSVSVSANVRQSTQIKMEDLRLPEDVIDTLQKQAAMSVRPNLSNALNIALKDLRTRQRKLYDELCIHKGDTHFLCDSEFTEAQEIIREIRTLAADHNAKLKDLWPQEFATWKKTITNTLTPLFEDEEQRAIVMEAYLQMFPTQQEFDAPIEVFVVGPYPVSLVVAKNADAITTAAVMNTKEVYEAAQESAADRAYEKCAELMDDLDCRGKTKIGSRQTGSQKRRGSWQIAAEELTVVAKHVPFLDKARDLAKELLKVGDEMSCLTKAADRTKAYERYDQLKIELRSEFESIVKRRESSQGADSLMKSLAMSGTYNDLKSKIQRAETISELNALRAQVEVEVSVYQQRSKDLLRHVESRDELITAANLSTDELLADVRNKPIEELSTDDCGF